MIDRNTIWIPVFADQRQNASLLFIQNSLTFIIGHLLFESSHFSEHDTPLYSIPLLIKEIRIEKAPAFHVFYGLMT